MVVFVGERVFSVFSSSFFLLEWGPWSRDDCEDREGEGGG